jgi:hypothetical protein
MERFRVQRVCDTITFFGSARIAPDGPPGRYYAEARELARLVTAWAMSLPSNEVIDFEALARYGVIDRGDLTLFRKELEPVSSAPAPAFARSRAAPGDPTGGP